MEAQQKAQLESLVSSALVLLAAMSGRTDKEAQADKQNPDIREHFRSALLAMLKEHRPDRGCWENMRGLMSYDDYLLGRKVDGKLTAHDLVRPNIPRNVFSNERQYVEHEMRKQAANREKRPEQVGEKTCSVCNQTKPANKFRHRGGAICHACRGKLYRERVATRATADRADER